MLGEVEKNSFVALQDKGEHNRLCPSKPCILPGRIWWPILQQWFKVVDKIRVCARPALLNLASNNPLMSFSSSFTLISGALLWNEECYIFHLLGGFRYVKTSKISLCVSHGVEPGPAPSLHYWLLVPSPLFLSTFPSLMSSCWNLPFRTQGRSWGLESIPYKQGMGDAGRLLCPGAPQGPAWFNLCDSFHFDHL